MRFLTGFMVLLAVAFPVAVSLPVKVSAQDAPKVEEPIVDPNHPVWTLVPTRIDRSKQHYVRIAPQTDAADRMILTPDRPIRIAFDGTFTAGGKPVAIFGLLLPDRQELCQTPSGARWACGIRAQAVFSALLAVRELKCTRVSPLGATLTVASCKSGNDDIAEKLIGDGWAEAEPNAGIALLSLQDAAQKAHRGRWSETIPEF